MKGSILASLLLFFATCLYSILGVAQHHHSNEHHHHLDHQRLPWSNPLDSHPNASYLCTCSKSAVSDAEMFLGPHTFLDENKNPVFRTCKIDNSLERHRYICAYFQQYAIMRYLVHTTPHSRAVRVLHNAPEKAIAKGLHLFNNSHIDYVGFDFAIGSLPYNDGFNEFTMDLCNMSFPDNYFDFVITSHVLEHVPNLQRCTQEIYRVMRPGAIGFIAIPYMANQMKTREKVPGKEYTEKELQAEFGQVDHVRVIGKDFVDMMKNTGFFVDPTTPKEFYNKYFPEGRKKYKNVEFRDSYDEHGIFFVVKDSLSKNHRPPHLHHSG